MARKRVRTTDKARETEIVFAIAQHQARVASETNQSRSNSRRTTGGIAFAQRVHAEGVAVSRDGQNSRHRPSAGLFIGPLGRAGPVWPSCWVVVADPLASLAGFAADRRTLAVRAHARQLACVESKTSPSSRRSESQQSPAKAPIARDRSRRRTLDRNDGLTGPE